VASCRVLSSSTVARVLALTSLALGASVVGCSAGEPDAPEQTTGASSAAAAEGERRATKLSEDAAALSVVVSACTTPEAIGDPTCPSEVLAAIRGGSGDQLKPRGIIDWNALYRDVLRRIGGAAKPALCRTLAAWKGFNNVYYNRGASISAGAVRVWTAGAELVYDLGDRQMSMFTFTGKARGNVAGASAGVYGGFAFSKNRHNLFDAWSGSSWGYQASYGIPETKILGITGSGFSNAEGDVVGVAAGLSVGFNFLNAWGADGAAFENEYTPWNAGTRAFSPAGATLETSGGYQFWSFGTKDGLGSGWWLAFEMIRFELDDVLNATNKYSIYVSQPTWAAALLTIGSEYVRFESAAQSIEDWCGGYAAVPTAGCGLGTATLGPRTCSAVANDDLGIDPPEVNVDRQRLGDCASDGAPSCDDRFPGQALVCSNASQKDAFCCRKPFPATHLCSTDGDCAADEVCALADRSTYACLKPGTQPCVFEKK
jgi:hypothetical protein